MRSRLSIAFSVVLFGTCACSSAAFDVGDPVADGASDEIGADASGVDSSTPTDTATSDDSSPTTDSGTVTPDSTAGPDTMLVADTKSDVTTVVDTGECTSGATKACECTGIRTCVAGKWGGCESECLPSPSRYLCAYGHDGCTETSCLDSHNCTAQCGCASSPGSTCALMDPCWGYVCNGFVCPM